MKVDSIPTEPEFITCEKHGEYQVQYANLLGRIYRRDYCGKCATDERIAREEKEKAAEDERDKLYRLRKRINAGISKRNLHKTFDDYICSNEGQEKAKADCVRFVDTFPSEKSLIMVGGVGTGKTLLASAIIEALIDKNSCEVVKLIELVRSIKESWRKDSDQSEQKILNHYIGLDLLIIDEVGSQFGSDSEKLFIFDIIDGRYQEMKQTILISNLDINGVKDAVGERCVDRLREGGGSMIAFNWSSARV